MDTGSNFVDEKPIINSAGNVASSLTSMSVELCLVCGDRASGRHYGAISCEGCKGFFKRSIRKQLGYQCRGTMSCEVTKHHRNRCQFCRLQKCLASGMRSDSVQHERKPISDKKEIQTSIASSLSVQSSSTSSYQKSKLFSHQNSSIISSPGSISENLASVFPVGFNFADLTQTLSKRALLAPATYQQQQISQQDNFLYSPGTQTNDDDSIDYSVGGGISGGENANSTGNVSENIQSTKNAMGASVITAGLIQNSISKNVITQSLELVTGIPQYYERNNSSKNNIERIDIVKEEMTDEPIRHDSDDAEEEQVIFEIPILPEGNVSFNLQTPTLVPSYFNAHYVCESGSRLLFLSVYWIKKNHAFQQLSEDIQISLLRHHWVKLFAVGLSQCCRLLSMSTIMSALVTNILQISESEKVLPSKIRKLSEHTCQLHEFVQTLQTMDLDEHEYAYVRLLLIFSPDSLNVKDFGKRRYIERLHEYALSCFRNYLADNHPGPDFRCTKILLKLMPLWSLESDVVEELFFSNLIGQVQIESMIPYILKLGGGGV